MIRAAFGLSEKQHKIVIVRMVTRLSHSKGMLKRSPPETVPLKNIANWKDWNVVPGFVRLQWKRVLDNWHTLEKETEESPYNVVTSGKGKIGIITTGLGKQYYLENKQDVPHLHISFYPLPMQKIRDFVSKLSEVYLIEEGFPYVERYLRGIVPSENLKIHGKLDGTIPLAGELNPDSVAKALAPLSAKSAVEKYDPPKFENIPVRPPQLCKGCPHCDAFDFIRDATAGTDTILSADIGCYALGSLPPYSLPLTLVDMGAAVTIAKGAADIGRKAIGIIGDSTFLHSGVTGLMDCVATNTPVVIMILDNYTTAMTGGQPQLLPSQRLAEIVKAVGVLPENLYELKPVASEHENNVKVLKKCLDTPAPTVIITYRECIVTIRRRALAEKAGGKA
jgi:indolepyruvate ferredoxin oxidoreductase alpha subunit